MTPSLLPEQAMLLLQLELPALQREHATTRNVIVAIPPEKGDYRPDPFSKSALELAWHVVAAEQRFYRGIAGGAFDFAPIHRPDNVKTSADIADWFEASFAQSLASLEKLTGDELLKIVDFRGIMQIPAVLYLQIAARHSIHHRGQLTAYLRAMGGKVPAIYGESYDSAEAKKVAQAN